MKPWMITAAILIIAIVLGLWQLKPVQVIEAEAGGTVQTPTDLKTTPTTNDKSDYPHAPHAHVDSYVNKELSEEHKNDLRIRLKDNTKSSDLEIISLPDGSKMSNLKGRFKHVPVAIKNPDGSVTIKEFYSPP